MSVYRKYQPRGTPPATVANPATECASSPRSVATLANVAGPSAESALTDDIEERAAIVEYDSAVPRPWALMYALLLTAPRPAWLSAEQWQAHHDAAGCLLSSWSAQMDRLGWNPADVLGVDPRWPGSAWEPSCLLSALVGITVGAISKDRISISFADGGTRCLERHNGKWVYA